MVAGGEVVPPYLQIYGMPILRLKVYQKKICARRQERGMKHYFRTSSAWRVAWGGRKTKKIFARRRCRERGSMEPFSAW